MTVALKQLLLNCGTSEMWWIWQEHFKRSGKVSQYVQPFCRHQHTFKWMFEVQIHKWACAERCYYKQQGALCCQGTTSANQCSSFNLNQLLIKSKTNSTKSTTLSFVLYVQVMPGAGAYFLSLPHQISLGFKCGVVFYFPFYPSFLYLCSFLLLLLFHLL